MELVPITCLLPWDLFEKILGFLGCPHICYHLARQLCKKTRNELLPRLVDWYFVEWWYPLDQEICDLNLWKTMSCVWKYQSGKHMKKTTIVKKGDHVRLFPIQHVRFCIPFKDEEGITVRLKTHKHPITLRWLKKFVEHDISKGSVQLVHTYQSNEYILGGYDTINSGERKSAFTVKVGDFILTESGKFKHVVETGRMKGGWVKGGWVWFTFKNPRYNMYLDEYDEVIIL